MLSITIGSWTFRQEVWVADIVDECLLGLDFLVRQECQVDLRDHVPYVGSEEVLLTRPEESSKPQCYCVVASMSVSLAPRSESVVPTQVQGLRGRLIAAWA